jgi:hypothetical protein
MARKLVFGTVELCGSQAITVENPVSLTTADFPKTSTLPLIPFCVVV